MEPAWPRAVDGHLPFLTCVPIAMVQLFAVVCGANHVLYAFGAATRASDDELRRGENAHIGLLRVRRRGGRRWRCLGVACAVGREGIRMCDPFL